MVSWRCWFRIRTLKFRLQNSIHFWANLGQKSKNWPFDWKLSHIVSRRCWFVFQHQFSEFPTLNLFSGKFGLKNQSCSSYLKIGPRVISKMLILIPILVFWISKPKSIFWENLGRKSKSCPFWLNIVTQSISRMLIRILTLAFWVSNPKLVFGQIWAKKKNKVVQKIDAQSISRMLILVPTWVFSISNPEIFFGEF